MDIKSRKSKSLGVLVWLLTIITGTLCGVASSFAISLDVMKDCSRTVDEIMGDNKIISWEDLDWYDRTWTITNFTERGMSDLISYTIIGIVAFAIIFFAGLVCLSIWSGRYRENDILAADVINYNWFDRAWSECHFLLFLFAMGGAVACAYPMVCVWPAFKVCKAYTPLRPIGEVLPIREDVALGLATLGMAVGIFLAIASWLSMIKKLKRHEFFKTSLIGKIYSHFYSLFAASDKTLLKCSLVFIIMLILAMTWVGAILDIIAFIVFIPRFIRKWDEIRKGLNEVKSGNLKYQIPVADPSSRNYGEFDRVAECINSISQAGEVAVQNELKHQRMKTDLISNVSHDLKTPLTSMISYVDLLKKEGLDSENASEYLRIVDEKTNRLKTLTENLFDAAKASSGAIPVNISSIDLMSLVNQSVGEMNEKLEKRALDVIVTNKLASDGETPENNAVKVMADGQLLWRVVENLLSNASKYALQGSRVYIDVEKTVDAAKGERVLLTIKNISEHRLNISADELLERFVRGDESRNTEGSGLGLAIARDLTNLMDGSFDITVDGDLFKAEVFLKPAE